MIDPPLTPRCIVTPGDLIARYMASAENAADKGDDLMASLLTERAEELIAADQEARRLLARR